LSFDARTRLEVPQRFKRSSEKRKKLSSKRRKKKMWRPSLSTVHKTAKTINLRTTTRTTINNSGDLIQAITQTGIK
jgi:hypothetical protein